MAFIWSMNRWKFDIAVMRLFWGQIWLVFLVDNVCLVLPILQEGEKIQCLLLSLFFFKLILKEKHSLSIYRLNHDKLGGAWCPKNTIQEGIREWIQIDLKQTHTITGIVTQVRKPNMKFIFFWKNAGKEPATIVTRCGLLPSSSVGTH